MRAQRGKRRHAQRALLLALGVLAGCSEIEAPDDELQPVEAHEVARITPAMEALSGSYVPTLDPVTMYEAEIRKALEPGPRCDFRYTTRGKPVLAISLQRDGAASGAVVKVNGDLIALAPASSAASGDGSGFLLAADPIRITVLPSHGAKNRERDNARRREADVVFEVGQSLRVGYRGYLDCIDEPPTISPRSVSGAR